MRTRGIMAEKPENNVYMPSEIIENEQGEQTVEEKFVTDAQKGLAQKDVENRIAEGKVNGDTNVKTKSVAQILRENIVTFFNFVFIALALLIFFFVDAGESLLSILGNFGFMLLIIFNALVGIFQEMRAKRTIDKLSLISAPKAIVIRDGEEKEIAVKDIVLDDLTVLSTGSQICADAVVVEGAIEVNESLITGEPDAILKNPGDEIMSGSFVVSGSAKAQVEHVGIDNFATKISSGAKYFKKPNSEIWRSLMLIVKVMASIIVPLGIMLFCVKYFVQKNPDDAEKMITTLLGYKISSHLSSTVLGTIATVIGMIPSGLVALSSTVFCVSVMRLSRHKTLAQDLYCVETLARVDVLCLDKTGTITEGTMEVNELQPAKGKDANDIKQIIKNVTSALDDDNATINALRAYVEDLKSVGEVEQLSCGGQHHRQVCLRAIPNPPRRCVARRRPHRAARGHCRECPRDMGKSTHRPRVDLRPRAQRPKEGDSRHGPLLQLAGERETLRPRNGNANAKTGKEIRI